MWSLLQLPISHSKNQMGLKIRALQMGLPALNFSLETHSLSPNLQHAQESFAPYTYTPVSGNSRFPLGTTVLHSFSKMVSGVSQLLYPSTPRDGHRSQI